jgi:hypothetical protein
VKYFDAFLSLGRTNRAIPQCPVTESDALRMMDRYDVEEALVYHAVARDSDADQGNAAVGAVGSARLHRVFAFDPSIARRRAPESFVAESLASGARAFLLNPVATRIRLTKSPRVAALARHLESRKLPLLLVNYFPPNAYAQFASDDDADWYEIAEFCGMFPRLPVLVWEQRTRSNRPMMDALALAPNLHVSISCVWQAGMAALISRLFGPERLVFSMGLPGLDPSSFQAVVAYAEVEQATRELIASGTLRRLLEEADRAP